MKKFLYLGLVFVLLSLISFNAPTFYSLKNYYPNATYSFYVGDEVTSSGLYTTIENAGLGTIVSCKAGFSSLAKKRLNNILGESLTFEGHSMDIFKLLNYYDANIVKEEILNDGARSVYASTNKINNSILIDDKKINLQIVYSNGQVTIGTPVILGSY